MSDQQTGRASETYWPDYYRVTAERPSWTTTQRAAEAFGAHPAGTPRFAVDLGCGAGRDTRELLRRGWRVLATDKAPEGIETLRRLTPPEHHERLHTHVGDLASFEIPACDLVNANLILPFLPAEAYAATWAGIRAAIPSVGRSLTLKFSLMFDVLG